MKIARSWGLLVLATATPMSVAQSLNVNLGPAGAMTPQSSYGRAKSQPGYWNVASGIGEVLLDVYSNATPVKSARSCSVGSRTLSGLSSGDRELMQSYFYGNQQFGSSEGLSMSKLAPSWYDVYIYA